MRMASVWFFKTFDASVVFFFIFLSKCVCGAVVVFHTDSDWGDAYSGKLIWFEFSWRLYSPSIFPAATFSSWHFIVSNSDVMAHVYRLNCECHNIWHYINMHPFFFKTSSVLGTENLNLKKNKKKCVFFVVCSGV